MKHAHYSFAMSYLLPDAHSILLSIACFMMAPFHDSDVSKLDFGILCVQGSLRAYRKLKMPSKLERIFNFRFYQERHTVQI